MPCSWTVQIPCNDTGSSVKFSFLLGYFDRLYEVAMAEQGKFLNKMNWTTVCEAKVIIDESDCDKGN